MKKIAWIWKIKDVEGGDPLKIAAAAKLAGNHFNSPKTLAISKNFEK